VAQASVELALKIQAAVEGLGEVSKLADEIEQLGGDASDVRTKAGALAEEMSRLGQQQTLLDSFKRLSGESRTAADALAQSQARTKELALELNQSRANIDAVENALKNTRRTLSGTFDPAEAKTLKGEIAALEKELAAAQKQAATVETNFSKSRQATREWADAAQAQRLALQQAGQAMTAAGLDADKLDVSQARVTLGLNSAKKAAAELTQELHTTAAGLATYGAKGPAFEWVAENARTARAGLDGTTASAKATGKGIADMGDEAPRTGAKFSEMGRALAGVFAAISVAATVSKLLELTQAVEGVDLRLKGTAKSAEDFAQTEQYLTRLSEDHHKALTDLAGSYAKLQGLEEAGLVTRAQSKALLEGMDNVTAKLGVTNAQTEQSMYGLSQALASGVVHAEEYRQVVEPIPGLSAKIDAAAGLAAGGFRKLVNEGRITSDMFRDVLIKALESYAGAAEASGATVAGKLQDQQTRFQSFIKAIEPQVNAMTGFFTDLNATWLTGIERFIATAEGKYSGFFSWLKTKTEFVSDQELADFTASIDGIKKKFDDLAGTQQNVSQAIDVTRDSITGLTEAEKISATILDGLKEKWDEAKKLVEARTQAVQHGLASQQELDQATQSAKKAEADYVLELGKAKKQLEETEKAADAHAKTLQSEYEARSTILQSQAQGALASAQEAEAAGKHTQAVQYLKTGLDALGQSKALDIGNAARMVQETERQAQAAQEHADMVRREAEAQDGVTEAEKAGIASAEADAAAKRTQVAAAQAQYAELTRLPASLAEVTNAQALQNGEVQRYYQAAAAAVTRAREMQVAQAEGRATSEQLAEAVTAAQVAIAKLAGASQVYAQSQYQASDAQRQFDQQLLASAQHMDVMSDGMELFGGIAESSGKQAISIYAQVRDALGQYSSAAVRDYEAVGDLARRANSWWMDVGFGLGRLASLQDQAAAADEAIAKLGTNDLGELREGIRRAELAMAGLDGTKFDGLRSQLESAKQKARELTQELRAASREALASAEQAEAAATKNAKLQENLRWQAQKAELEAKISQAGAAGDGESVANYRKALQSYENVHRQRIGEIDAENSQKLEDQRIQQNDERLRAAIELAELQGKQAKVDRLRLEQEVADLERRISDVGKMGNGASRDAALNALHQTLKIKRDALEEASRIDGARESGGPVEKGKRYLVGERGPEIVEFPEDGNVIPNNRLGDTRTGRPHAPSRTIELVLTVPGGQVRAIADASAEPLLDQLARAKRAAG
jgi:tape measure domain-containing protein